MGRATLLTDTLATANKYADRQQDIEAILMLDSVFVEEIHAT